MKKLIKLTNANGGFIYFSEITKIFEIETEIENETEMQIWVNGWHVKETTEEILVLIAESNGDVSISQIERDYSETLIKLHDLERMFETEILSLKTEINGLQRIISGQKMELQHNWAEIANLQSEISNFKKVFGNIDTQFTEIETRLKNFEA